MTRVQRIRGLVAGLLGAGAVIWLLGDRELHVNSVSSPNGTKTVHVYHRQGWRLAFNETQYRFYLSDERTRKLKFVTAQPDLCIFNRVSPGEVTWAADGAAFSCRWIIQRTGTHTQRFQVVPGTLEVKAGPGCCGVG